MSGFVVEGGKQNFVIVERDKEDFFLSCDCDTGGKAHAAAAFRAGWADGWAEAKDGTSRSCTRTRVVLVFGFRAFIN